MANYRIFVSFVSMPLQRQQTLPIPSLPDGLRTIGGLPLLARFG
jgi:hypothetical protein